VPHVLLMHVDIRQPVGAGQSPGTLQQPTTPGLAE
jgi:hypothetical protein